MIFDLKKENVSSNVLYDICIVGAGAAGITIAKYFANSSTKVALVESGNFNFDQETQNLYKGETVGNLTQRADRKVLEGHYLHTSRLRYFGGTTNHWGGWCRPLDDLDFEYRNWVPDSEWPILKKDLEPYYKEAEKVVEINSFAPLEQRQYQWGKNKDESKDIRAPFFQFSRTQFRPRYRKEITEAKNVDLFLNSNLTNIKLSENKKRVNHIEIVSLNGNHSSVKAKFIIIACGGIENPRILLNCRDDISDGIGNQNGLVGKYFMEHPHYYNSGKLLTWSWEFNKIEKFYGDWSEFRLRMIDGVINKRVFSLSESTQKENRLLNISFEIVDFSELDRNKETLAKAIADLSENILNFDGMIDKPVMPQINIRAEQGPKESNSVSLIGEKDELGMNKIRLTCNVSDDEINNYLKSMQILGKSLGLGVSNNSRLRIDLNKESQIHGGPHHMGTTRMSENPKKGVVDKNCKIHGIDNLFIAGSSVFPTGGFAHPTFTIVALSIRLADHVKNILEQ